ncbi:MAG: CoA-binding protein [Desulfobacteraceae bacterium]|nr:MAG: CoA-binding protein [Desulfobacteraceae bacterium]
MEVQIHFDKITQSFQKAIQENRTFLFEYEIYELLKNSGSETPPQVHFLKKDAHPREDELSSIPGNRIVMKIVSPTIIHKTEVKGVKILDNQPAKIRSSRRRMMDEIPANYASWMEKNKSLRPPCYANLSGEDLLQAIRKDIQGVLLCQYMPPDSEAFGNELLVSIRKTREFGMIITAGLGGTDTELYATRFRKGQAIVSASTEMIDGESFFHLFRQTIAYQKLAGISRGQTRIVSDQQLIECFSSFISMANYYSPFNPDAPVIIEELEINPFAFTDYQMVPLDGLCSFSFPKPLPVKRPLPKIHHLLHPKTIAIIGVSITKNNFGKIILKNILAAGFRKSNIVIIRPDASEINGVTCVSSLSALKRKIDLFVVAVSAENVPGLVQQVIDLDAAESVMLIPAGIGEKKGSEQKAEQLHQKISSAHLTKEGGPVFLGSNCMGVISFPGHYDTVFVPKEKLSEKRLTAKRNSAFISQSGAFLITRTGKLPNIDPGYMISIGNQIDLTVGDIVTFLKDLDHIDILAIYMEGFNEMDGLSFCRSVRQAVENGKQIIFYKAGRTPEGKTATSSHTASLAGDYAVCESCVRQAGAMVADNFSQFEDLYVLATRFHTKKITGNRLAVLSGAGFVAVGMADNIQGETFSLQMSSLSSATISRLEKLIREHHLDALVDIKNPMDINPAANDLLHIQITEVLLQDPSVDCIVIGIVPMSPAMQTLPEPGTDGHFSENSIAVLLPELVKQSQKPIITVVDGGTIYDPLVEALEKGDIPVFRTADRAVAAAAKYIEGQMYADLLRNKKN